MRWTGLAVIGVVMISGAVAAPQEPGIVLAKDGQSAYRIVLQSGASPSERFAAEELQTHFGLCTGVELPIVEAPDDTSLPMVVLGCGSIARELGVEPTAAELGEQGCRIRTVPPHVVLAGSEKAGTLYGVYDFLESQLVVRWFAPGVTETPAVTEVEIPAMDRLLRPAFAWRFTDCAWPGADGAFRARQRYNVGGGGPDSAEGMLYDFDGICHSYFTYVSPGEFFETHPEYFSEIGGIRRSRDTQLCLTNPDVLEIVTERMLARMAERPNCRQHNFSQMDYYNYCQCARCTEINERYGTSGGTQYWFLNQLAARTAEVYPDKQIGTLAYMYTEEPPEGMTMHPNVAVWLCHMYPCCDSHSIAECPLNADYKRRAIAWSKICSHLDVWHYITNFSHYYMPFPDFDAMAADMRFYRDIGVEGIFLEGMPQVGGEFGLLRPYYGMKLLWEPDQDARGILREFLKGYYGAAGDALEKYIDLLHEKVAVDNIHMHLFTNPAQGYLTDEVLERADVLFDEAEAAVAEDEELLERVRVARMPLTYARLFPRNGYTIEDGHLRFRGPLAPVPEAVAMSERMAKHGFSVVRINVGDTGELAELSVLVNSPLPVPTIRNGHLIVETVPVLGGRALRITHRASNQCITAFNTTRNLFFPFAGGEETRLGEESNLLGVFTQYAVTGQSETSITLEGAAGPWAVKRTLTLVPDAAVLEVRVDLTNTTSTPQEAAVRSHLELDLGELAHTRVQFTNRAGARVERTMAPIIAGLREGEHYTAQNVPAGEWRFTGTKGIEVTQRFDGASTDFTWLYAYPEDLNTLDVEVWRKPVSVGPGETVTFSHTLEVGGM